MNRRKGSGTPRRLNSPLSPAASGPRSRPHGTVALVMMPLSLILLIFLFYSKGGGRSDQTEMRTTGNEGQSESRASSAALATVPSFIKKSSGPGWNLWDGQTILFGDEPFAACRWVTFRGGMTGRKNGPGAVELPMCVHPENDVISSYLAISGYWRECSPLVRLWRDPRSATTTPLVHVDIGANLGSCILEILLTTNATIVAFEPSPKNLFSLTSTLVRLDPKYRDRIWLFPIALGARGSTTELLHGAEGNYGNSVLGHPVQDVDGQEFMEPVPVPVERLDDLLDVQHTEVGVMKLDAQGYECSVMDGMPQTLSRTKMVRFEVEEKWLQSFGNCSGAMLFRRFRDDYSMEIYNMAMILKTNNPRRDTEYFFAIRDG